MKTLINNITGEVIFLYELTKGESSSSFGIKVAEMLKLPETIIRNSKFKAREFRRLTGLDRIKIVN